MILQRFFNHPDGTPGKMGGWYSFEEENQGNQRNISRIPEGRYRCERTWYNRGGYETFEVTNVPGRSHILIHRGNTEEDSEGCILLGKSFGALVVDDEDTGRPTRKLAILRSREAFREFMYAMDGVNAFDLEVIDP